MINFLLQVNPFVSKPGIEWGNQLEIQGCVKVEGKFLLLLDRYILEMSHTLKHGIEMQDYTICSD